MSRTNKGNKGPGYDYWSDRPESSWGYGPKIKRVCKKRERARSKDKLRNEKFDDLRDKESF